jgi:branched-chain amino acid transport system permease protein
MGRFVSLLASGVSDGAVVALVAVGFLLLFKATGIINFAHGELVTLGAYFALWADRDLGMPIVVAYLFTLLLMFFVGVGLERIAYAPLRKRPLLVVVISTLAAATIIRSLIALWQGSSPHQLGTPIGSGVVHVLGGVISYQRIVVVAVAGAAIAATVAVFQRTATGRQLRSLAFDPEAAQLCGVRTRRISLVAFGISSILAALAGILISPLSTVNLTFGFDAMVLAFAASVLGGFGSIGGVALGGLVIGIIQQLIGGYIFVNYAETLPFIVMFLIIVFRPRGLLGAARARL